MYLEIALGVVSIFDCQSGVNPGPFEELGCSRRELSAGWGGEQHVEAAAEELIWVHRCSLSPGGGGWWQDRGEGPATPEGLLQDTPRAWQRQVSEPRTCSLASPIALHRGSSAGEAARSWGAWGNPPAACHHLAGQPALSTHPLAAQVTWASPSTAKLLLQLLLALQGTRLCLQLLWGLFSSELWCLHEVLLLFLLR